MTWIAGALCFNGFVCVGDVRVTATQRSKVKEIDCVRKVYRLYDNLVLGFSGDLRICFHMRDRLRDHLEHCLRPQNHIFDLDGELANFQHNLRHFYREVSPRSDAPVSLMLLWFAQDEGEYLFRNYCWTFSSPDFRRDGAQSLSSLDLGSGSSNPRRRDLINYMTGRESSREEELNAALGTYGATLHWTVKRFETVLVQEASKLSERGVSKTLTSIRSTMAFDRIFSDADHALIEQLGKKLGLRWEHEGPNGPAIYAALDENSVREALVKHIEKNPREALADISLAMRLQRRMDLNPLYEAPTFTESTFISPEESVKEEDLVTTWEDFRKRMRSEGFTFGADARAVV